MVTITLSDVIGNLGTVTETLPAGFDYASSSLNDAQVSENGQVVTFTLLGEASFTYNVTAPDTEGGPHNIHGRASRWWQHLHHRCYPSDGFCGHRGTDSDPGSGP